MEVSADISLPAPDAAERESAKQRLYVLFQAAGWGAWLIMEMIVTFSFPEPDHKRDISTNLSFVIMFVAVGVLLTHLIRPIMRKRQWKQLGWPAAPEAGGRIGLDVAHLGDLHHGLGARRSP